LPKAPYTSGGSLSLTFFFFFYSGSPFLPLLGLPFLLHERLTAETDYRDTAKTDKATQQKSLTSVLIFKLLHARKKDTIKVLSAVSKSR